MIRRPNLVLPKPEPKDYLSLAEEDSLFKDYLPLTEEDSLF
jgi:hypothetical protein